MNNKDQIQSYYIYLSITGSIEPFTVEQPIGTYICTLEVTPLDLDKMLDIMQMTADAVVIQLYNKAQMKMPDPFDIN